MPRNIAPLTLIAVIAVVVATMAALAASDTMEWTDTAGRAPGEAHERPSRPTSSAPVDPVRDLARSYALAARNWTPGTYPASWSHQIRLAGGHYRRELIARRPGRRELVALRKDRTQSTARVLRTERDQGVRPPAARVLVTLDESTHAAGQTVGGLTLNEVRLQRRDDRWRVVGWTVVPRG